LVFRFHQMSWQEGIPNELLAPSGLFQVYKREVIDSLFYSLLSGEKEIMKKPIFELCILSLFMSITHPFPLKAEMEETPSYQGVVTDKRDPREIEDDRYWYGKEDEKEFLRYTTDKDMEKYKVVNDPDFSNAQWGPWTMERGKDDVIVFKKHHGTTLLFYGNPLILETISETPIGANIHFGELETEESSYKVEDKLLLQLEGEKSEKKKKSEGEEEDREPIIIRNEYPGGYEYQTVRKYTDVGVWVVMRPR